MNNINVSMNMYYKSIASLLVQTVNTLIRLHNTIVMKLKNLYPSVDTDKVKKLLKRSITFKKVVCALGKGGKKTYDCLQWYDPLRKMV